MTQAAIADGPERRRPTSRDVASGDPAASSIALPFALVANNGDGKPSAGRRADRRRRSSSARLREVVQPIVDKNGSLSSDFAPGDRLGPFRPARRAAAEADAGRHLHHLPGRAPPSPRPTSGRRAMSPLQPSQTLTARSSSASGTVASTSSLYAIAGRGATAGKPAVIAFDKYSHAERPATLMPLPASAQGPRRPRWRAADQGLLGPAVEHRQQRRPGAVKAYVARGCRPDQLPRRRSRSSSLAGDYVARHARRGHRPGGQPGRAPRRSAGSSSATRSRPIPCPSDADVGAATPSASQAYVDFFKAQHACASST